MRLDSESRGQATQQRQTLVISANSFWNIANFRASLVDALVDRGWRVVVAAPDIDENWTAEHRTDHCRMAVDRSGLNPIRDGSLFLNYCQLMRRLRANYFLGFTAKPNIYGSIAASLSGATSLPNVSGLGTAFIGPRSALSLLVGTLYRIAFARCPVVFFQNGDDLALFVERRIVSLPQARLLPGSGVDLDHFTPAPWPDPTTVRFLLIGRLIGDKGVREFIEAAHLLKTERPTWTFQLLGSVDEGNRTGIRRDELDRWIADGTIEYLGSTDDIRPFIAASTAVVLPSYREGMPRSLLEAAAMARPLIATDVPGCSHLVQQGINGLLCAPRNFRSLADAMRRFGDMGRNDQRAMGDAGRALVERSFGEDRVIEAYLDALGKLSSASVS